MAKHAGASDDAVMKATGRDWAGWVAELDRAGAATRTHKEIAALLHDELGDVNLYPKGPSKAQLAIQHSKLPDPAAVTLRKVFGKEALDRLSAPLAR